MGIVHAIGVQACKLADLMKTTATTTATAVEERENFPAKKNLLLNQSKVVSKQ